MDNSIKINRLREIKKFFSRPIMLCVVILEIIIFLMDLTFYILTHNNLPLDEHLFVIFVSISEFIMIVGLLFIYIYSRNNLNNKSFIIGIIIIFVSVLLSIFSLILFYATSASVNTSGYGPLFFVIYYCSNFNLLYYFVAAIAILFIKRNIAEKSLNTKIYTIFFIVSIMHILLQLQAVLTVSQLGILIIRLILKTILCIIVTIMTKNYNDSFIKSRTNLI